MQDIPLVVASCQWRYTFWTRQENNDLAAWVYYLDAFFADWWGTLTPIEDK